MRFLTLLLVFTLVGSFAHAAENWLQWRGPSGLNLAVGDNSSLPTEWSASEKVLWKTEVPGRGHSSPIVVGDRIFLTSADEAAGKQLLLCYDRETGQLFGTQVVSEGPLSAPLHKKNTWASSTPASDGERVFTVFHVGDEIILNAFDLSGRELWEKVVSPYRDSNSFGYGASPTIYDGNVIVIAQDKAGGAVVAFDTESGGEAWRTPLGYENTSYSSPIVATAGGVDQLVFSGNHHLQAFDPSSGALRWKTGAGALVTCGTAVWDDERIYSSGGYPEKITAAVKADGSEVAWTNGRKVYEQSMLIDGGYVYAVDEGGVAYCWRAEDGETMWRGRLEGGGPISASPILVNGLVYVSMERGQSFVFRASPEKLDVVATNQLGDAAFASPVIVDGRLYLRVGETSGVDRQEWLYCIGD